MPLPKSSPRRAGKKATKQQLLGSARSHWRTPGGADSSNWRVRHAEAGPAEAAAGGDEGEKGHQEVLDLCKQFEAICANPTLCYNRGPFLANELKEFRAYLVQDMKKGLSVSSKGFSGRAV